MRSQISIGVRPGLAAEFMMSGVAGSDSPFVVVRLEEEEGLDAVLKGVVDMALVSPLEVIVGSEDIEVVPAVALSSWRYPFAQLFMPGGLASPPETIYYDPQCRTEAQLARVILKEHYGIEPSFECSPADDEAVADDAIIDGWLRVGSSVPLLQFDGLRLDLGQEWYELANYPMVWGVFAMMRDSVTSRIVEDLRDVASRTELLRTSWAGATDGSESIRRFFLDDVRVRFDDLATASIAQLNDFAFYYDLTDEVRDFPVASVEIDQTDDGPNPLL